jgi:hypothetical protein
VDDDVATKVSTVPEPASIALIAAGRHISRHHGVLRKAIRIPAATATGRKPRPVGTLLANSRWKAVSGVVNADALDAAVGPTRGFCWR